MPRIRFGRPLALLGSLLLALGITVGCASAEHKTVLSVFAATSLNQVFTDIGKEFNEQHPDVEVRFNFGGSSALATQINEGADADLLATADERTMEMVTGPTDPTVFATNQLIIVTQPGNPEQITGFADLARPGLSVVVCAVEVPCGAATAAVEDDTGVDLDPVSQETSVAATLAKVTSGEADAALVYVTDARAAGDRVTTVNDPAFAEVINAYPVTVLRDGGISADVGDPEDEDSDAERTAAATAFKKLVLGETGRQLLEAAGFGLPDR